MSRQSQKIRDVHDIQSVSKDAPLKLALAAKLAFPDGSMSASGLRREARKGRLVVERIAGKDYTTVEAIEEMRKLCRIDRRASDYGFEGEEAQRNQPGSSVMDQGKYALDAAFLTAKRLKESSVGT